MKVVVVVAAAMVTMVDFFESRRGEVARLRRGIPPPETPGLYNHDTTASAALGSRLGHEL